MEGVQHQADVRMVDLLQDAPGVAIVLDPAPPADRLPGHPGPEACREVSQHAQVVGDPSFIRRTVGRDVGAQHERLQLQQAHLLEQLGGDGELAVAARVRHALEVAQVLVAAAGEAQLLEQVDRDVGTLVVLVVVARPDLRGAEACRLHGAQLVR